MRNVLTLIAATTGPALSPDIVGHAKRVLTAFDLGMDDIDWLAPETACDIFFEGGDLKSLRSQLTDTLRGLEVDLAVQPMENRRKKLLLADMDSTIVTSETLDELAGHAGLKDKIAAITRRAMQGEIDFHDALRERVRMLAGLPVSALETTAATIDVSPGAAALIRTMRANGAFTALVSGGFTYFTERIAHRVGFDTHYGNELEIVDGKLTGEVVEPILGRDGKLNTLTALTKEKGLALSDTITVGDGANDLPMLQASGLGVAYRAKPIAAQGAAACIDVTALDSLLYLQGYRQEDFVS